MFGQLVPCGGGNPIPLRLRRNIIGRALECDIVISDLMISAKHCLLEMRDGIWNVSDLASSNGIAINGVRCPEGQLHPGTVLTIAKNRYVVDYSVGGVATSRSGPVKQSAVASGSITEVRQPGLQPDDDTKSYAKQSDGWLGELIPCGGGAPIALRKRRLIIGRSPSCDIVIGYPKVSSKHCQLDFHLGYWHVRDLGSLNGIRVDGNRQFVKALMPGAILSIAEHRYQMAYAGRDAGSSVGENVSPVGQEPTAAMVDVIPSQLPVASDVKQDCVANETHGS